jgi:GH25 family lysozyme M1 (1,4-beta-N-acetylmuramidase)
MGTANAAMIDLSKYDGDTEKECRVIGSMEGRYFGNLKATRGEKNSKDEAQYLRIAQGCEKNGLKRTYESAMDSHYKFYACTILLTDEDTVVEHIKTYINGSECMY